MAKDKKSFLLYCDLLEVVKELDDKSKGELFLHILEYVNDLNPEPPNQLVKMLFIPIKQALKRDLIKYESIRSRNKINGSKGGRPKNPNKPTGLTGNPTKPKKADTDTDTDTVNEKEIFIKEEIWSKFQPWIKDNQLNKDKVYAQFDKAWFYYEDLNWKNKNGKVVINPVSTIRNNWFKDLTEYKLSRREINDLRPPLETIFTDGR